MAISSIPTASLPAPSQSANGNTPGSIGDQLLASLAKSQAASGATADPLLQSLVTLGSGSGQSSAAPSPLTYNAQGLLNQVESAMQLNDPLLQSSDSGTDSSSAAIDGSLLSSLLASGQPTAGTGPASSTPDPNLNWAKILQKDPAMTSAFLANAMDQGLIKMLP